LDSIASSIGYAWLSHEINGTPTVALIQTGRDDLRLRAENQHALSLAGLEADAPELLCFSDLSELGVTKAAFPSHTFALVDHNRLGDDYEGENTKVVAIFDHHKDEDRHTDANPRVLEMAGSCASLVARALEAQCPARVPAPLAQLLLCATIIDTHGLKPGGKATQADVTAAHFLYSCAYPNSAGAIETTPINEVPEVADLNEQLQDLKENVGSLGTCDLLRRDFKDYVASGTRVGLASVPIGFEEWFASPRAEGGKFWTEAVEWMEEARLDALGVLTSFRDNEMMNKKGKGKHRREQLWIVRASSGDLATRLFEGLKADKDLDLKKKDLKEVGAATPKELEGAWQVQFYKQKNTDATRKVTAPIVQRIIEGNENGSGKL
jgi:exopolyphosphatase